jgi:putative hydrolase of HD superfamily
MCFSKDINKIQLFIKLKESKRFGVVDKRFESSAEHTCSCILLAQYFIKKISNVDENKVIKMLSYHDLFNVFLIDINLNDPNWNKKKELEKEAYNKVILNLPEELIDDYKKYMQEFEEQKTIESKFAKAIDVLEPVIHAYNQKEFWKEYKWTEKDLRKYKEKYFIEFPTILKFFNDFVDYANLNDYFYKEM